jgi:hypothetical protein
MYHCSDNTAVAGSSEVADEAEEEGGYEGLQREKGNSNTFAEDQNESQ